MKFFSKLRLFHMPTKLYNNGMSRGMTAEVADFLSGRSIVPPSKTDANIRAVETVLKGTKRPKLKWSRIDNMLPRDAAYRSKAELAEVEKIKGLRDFWNR